MKTLIPVFRTHVPVAARRRAADVLASGWLGYGPECRALEARFQAGRPGFALATGSCTSALYLAALLLRQHTKAREVIVPAVTFIATAMAFHHAGFRIRVANVDPHHLMLSPDTVAPLLGTDTAAVVAVHLYGQPCRAVTALRALCDAHGAALIEDCAHRLDLLDAGAPAGDFACYSFNAVKEIPCGEGGVLWGRDATAESPARAFSNAGLGIDTLQRAATACHADYQFTQGSGLKLRLNDVAAALVNGALDLLPAWRLERATQFERYDAQLAGLGPQVRTLERNAGDSFLMYVLRVPAHDRDAIRAHLAEHGVASSVHYPSLARHPLFRDDADPKTRMDVDDALITLPSFLGMTADDQRVVAAAVASGADRALAESSRSSRDVKYA